MKRKLIALGIGRGGIEEDQKGKRKSAPGLPDWSPTSVLPWLDAA